uniref:cell division protein ZapC n=1 Tax=Thaumasiovibrio occultus TaxID=1891184 RepID=UPI000B350EA5|nr:cell division protein ZapC [Thaumasiovibrio occultus]
MLKPNNTWTWFFHADEKQLMLDLGDDMIFQTALPAKHLIPDAMLRQAFSVEDATLFQAYMDGVSALALSAPRQAELVLNAVAAQRFHKPMLPKSWFFNEAGEISSPEVGEIVQLETPHGQAQFVVIENSGSASLCMMASLDALSLDGNKSLRFCDTIKVMNDRMYNAYEAQLCEHFAKVG